jgi:two-component system sensor histidine kinase UhpB
LKREKVVKVGAAGVILRRLARTPLSLKLIIANAVLVAIGVCAGLAAGRLSAAGEFAVVVLAIAATIAANALIVRAALRPLALLQDTAARVAAGDVDVRTPDSVVADRATAHLVDTFNAVLDSAEETRRRLREIARRAQHAAEEERKRIARELHDGIAQGLAALRLRLRLARSADNPELLDQRLAELSDTIGAMIEEVRGIALGLRPPVLDVLGIGPAVESLSRSVEQADLVVDVRAHLAPGELRPEAELALYRILQEALANVVRHADAQHVRVRLGRTNGMVSLSVEDDGRGFAAGRRFGGTESLGLFGMQERAAYVGGTVDVESEPGSGTRVIVELPGTGTT